MVREAGRFQAIFMISLRKKLEEDTKMLQKLITTPRKTSPPIGFDGK